MIEPAYNALQIQEKLSLSEHALNKAVDRGHFPRPDFFIGRNRMWWESSLKKGFERMKKRYAHVGNKKRAGEPVGVFKRAVAK